MTVVHYACSPDNRFVARQTPNGDGCWEDFRFVFEAGSGPADWLLVYDAPYGKLETRIPRHRRIVVLSEPPSIRHYDDKYLDQFGVVVAPAAPNNYKGVVKQTSPAIPWFYGLDFDHLTEIGAHKSFRQLQGQEKAPAKSQLLSAVCSTKKLNRNQVRRLRFLDMLKAKLGDELAIYGRGFQQLRDKAEGIDGFRYHMVLENNLDRDAWTEKLADPILAGAYPIVAGGGGLDSYFDSRGFIEIDIRSPKQAVREIAALLAEDPAGKPDVQQAMLDNKKKLMEVNQVFPLIVSVIREQPGSTDELSQPVTITGPRKSKWRHLTKPFRMLMPYYHEISLRLVETK